MSFIHHLTLGYFDPEALWQDRQLVVTGPLSRALVQELDIACRECFGLEFPLLEKLTPQGVIQFPYLGPKAVNEQLYQRGYQIGSLAHQLFGMLGTDFSFRGELVFPEKPGRAVSREELFESFKRVSAANDEAIREMVEKSHEEMLQNERFREQVRNRVKSFCRFDPSWLAWNDGTVSKLARAIVAEDAFDRLSILADALEDAGCDNADILTHCRGHDPQVRCCWVVTLASLAVPRRSAESGCPQGTGRHSWMPPGFPG
jgi:hypothetical protein